MPPGRPRRPPRTDPSEVQRNRDQKLAELQDRTVALYPLNDSPPQPTEPTARAAAIQAEWARITGFVPPPPLPAVTSAGIPEAATDGTDSPETGDFPSSGKWLTAAQIEQLANDDTCPNAMLAKAWQARPAWVAEAFISSVAVVKEKFGPARQGPVPCRLLSPMAAKLMLEPTAAGLESLHAHADRALRLFSAFAARGPLPPEYAEMFNRVFVPTYNAINFESRRCLDCGKVFALRTSTDIEKSRHCSDACDRRASKRGRERVGNGRSAADNAARRVSERYKRHFRTCPQCKAGKACEKAGSLHISLDALDRFRGDLPD